MFDVAGSNVARPLNVEVGVASFDHNKSGVFERIDHCVIDVGVVRDAERHKEKLDFFFGVDAYAVTLPLEVDVVGVVEESRGGSALENGLQEVNLPAGRLENGVGQTSLFSPNKNGVNRVLLNEFVNFEK